MGKTFMILSTNYRALLLLHIHRYQPLADSILDKFRSVMNVQLLHHACPVSQNCLHTNAEQVSDLTIGTPLGNQLQYLPLSAAPLCL